jgi:competence protein ComEC
MAVLYLGARLLGLRSPPWQAVGVAALLVVGARPLDVRNVGFLLTFGATAALIEAATRAGRVRRWPAAVRWLAMSIVASAVVEIALVPVSAYTFSRVTSAGLVLNLAAVPLMTLAQVGGLASVLLDSIDTVSAAAGHVAAVAAGALVSSARLVELAPWLSARVPPPGAWLIATYYGGLATALVPSRAARIAGITVLGACMAAIAAGTPVSSFRAPDDVPPLRLTMFDVGQGESMLLESGGSALLVDAGGIPFGGGSFDVGTRVLAPALWARALRRIDAFLFTHGDPDHVGGAVAVIDDFRPGEVWYGIPVPGHRGLRDLIDLARKGGAVVEHREEGERLDFGRARLRVLHPPAPDWERQRVRNDDSVVLEVLHGDVAMLLLGDVGAGVERGLLPRLTHAETRILKVAHHGSRTSTSPELVEQWRPHVALISAGRGNTFGHPAPEVLARLESVGATIYRTDRDGQITIDSDGKQVTVRTHAGGNETGAAPHRPVGGTIRRSSSKELTTKVTSTGAGSVPLLPYAVSPRR